MHGCVEGFFRSTGGERLEVNPAPPRQTTQREHPTLVKEERIDLESRFSDAWRAWREREGTSYASLWASRLGSSRLGSGESSSASEHWSGLQVGHALTSAFWQNESPGEGEECLLCYPAQVFPFEGNALPPFFFDF